MSVETQPNGRYKAVVKQHGLYLTSMTFDTKREALAWERHQLALLNGGIDFELGKLTVEHWAAEYITMRFATVAESTATTDRHMLAMLPTYILRLRVRKVHHQLLQHLMIDLANEGRAQSSLVRFRATLTKFFKWLKKNRVIADNPVEELEIPRTARPPREMRPFTERELQQACETWVSLDPEMAAVALFLARTGLRWSEAVELRVKDFQAKPDPVLTISRARSKSFKVKAPKHGRTRRVWLEKSVAKYVKKQAKGKDPEDLILPPLHRASFVSRLNYTETSGGRTIHELRHTYATTLITRGVKLDTVAEWMGHKNTTTTSKIYVHWLGSDENRKAIKRLNKQHR